jgi:hypothetical protein
MIAHPTPEQRQRRKTQKVPSLASRKQCHPNFCRPVTAFRVASREQRAPAWRMAFVACCGITCTMHYPIKFSREAPPATGCVSAVQTPVSTTPLTCEPNLRTILDPSGLLRDQSLATTTKIHRQLDVFPNSHTRHNPRNNQQPAPAPSIPCRGGGGCLLPGLSPRDIAFSGGLN